MTSRTLERDPFHTGAWSVDKVTDGLEIRPTFRQARTHEEAGRAEDALREYEKAVQWLPADDPNRQIARTRIEQLKKH